jgi:hypothetical protein
MAVIFFFFEVKAACGSSVSAEDVMKKSMVVMK